MPAGGFVFRRKRLNLDCMANSIIDQQIQDSELLTLTAPQKQFLASVLDAAFRVQAAAIEYIQSTRPIPSPKFRSGGIAMIGEKGRETVNFLNHGR